MYMKLKKKNQPHLPVASTLVFGSGLQYVCTAEQKLELPSQAQWNPHGKSLWNSLTASHAGEINAQKP